MLHKEAFNFAKAVSDLCEMEVICSSPLQRKMDAGQIADTRARIVGVADQVLEACHAPDVGRRLRPEIDRFKRSAETEHLHDVARSCMNLRERLLEELEGELYLHVHGADLTSFGTDPPFGSAVASKFPASTPDFARAIECLALRQPTACVFHLMRGVEAAVRRLARKLSMTVAPTSTWRSITGAMDARIATLPQQTARERSRKDEWRDARMNLDALGSVVRNTTMHAASSYTQEEARQILGLVQAVMPRLCRL